MHWQTKVTYLFRGGFVDAIYLAWFDDGLSGQKLDMSEKTFQRGLKELLERGFLSPKAPNLFWVNPALFFRGDRVLFLKEYRRIKPKATPKVEPEIVPEPPPKVTPPKAPIPRQTRLAGQLRQKTLQFCLCTGYYQFL